MVTLSPQLSWSHYVELIELENDKERRFYEQKTILFSWSIRELRNNINNHLYQKTDNKEIEELNKIKLPAIIDIKNSAWIYSVLTNRRKGRFF